MRPVTSIPGLGPFRPAHAGLAFVALLATGCSAMEDSPFRSEDLCFVSATPGATTRHLEFTPVRCSAPETTLGPAVGADYGRLRFDDTDGDGRPEAIVESSKFRCSYGAAPCHDAWKVVLRVDPKKDPVWQETQREFLKALTQNGD